MQCLWYILNIYHVHHSLHTQHVEIVLMLIIRKGWLENINFSILIHVTQPLALAEIARRCCCIQRGFVDKTRLEWSNFHFYDTANHSGQLISRSGRGSLLGWNRAPVFFTAWWLWQSVPLFFTSLMTQANTGRGFGLFTQLVGQFASTPAKLVPSEPTNQESQRFYTSYETLELEKRKCFVEEWAGCGWIEALYHQLATVTSRERDSSCFKHFGLLWKHVYDMFRMKVCLIWYGLIATM